MMTKKVTQKATSATRREVWIDFLFLAPRRLPMPEFFVVVFMIVSFSFIAPLSCGLWAVVWILDKYGSYLDQCKIFLATVIIKDLHLVPTYYCDV